MISVLEGSTKKELSKRPQKIPLERPPKKTPAAPVGQSAVCISRYHRGWDGGNCDGLVLIAGVTLLLAFHIFISEGSKNICGY